MGEQEVGRVTHFFTKASVAAVELKAPLAVGDTVLFRGATTEFEQDIASMQIEKDQLERAEAGQSVGIKVKERVRVGDAVLKK